MIRPKGSIVVCHGSAGARPQTGGSVAGRAIAAGDAITEALAVVPAPLRVSAVVAGVVRTGLWDGVPDPEREAAYAAAGQVRLSGRVRESEEIAQTLPVRIPDVTSSARRSRLTGGCETRMSEVTADSPLRGRVALVTGASGGIGRAIALALAAEGVAVALAYGTRAQVAEDLANRITNAGGRAIALAVDLANSYSAGQLVKAAENGLGPIDVLVANAGRGQVHTLDDLSVEEFDRTLAINLRAPFLLAQQTLPGMRERGFGRVLFLSSAAAFTGGIVGAHYAASKAGLHGLTHYLASRFAPAGVTVNALAPALITDTGMLPGTPEQLREQIPLRRLGQPAEVADLALAILRNPYITNQVVSIDGGIHPR